jgi:hypothetical protein
MSNTRTKYFDPRDIEIVNSDKGARFNPRTLTNPGFSDESISSLRRGIAKDGLNHSLLIRLDERTDKPKLVAGERRLRAILQLMEADEIAKKKIASGEECRRVLVKNQKNGRLEPALKVYGEDGVECKITDEKDEKEFLRQAIQENTLHEALTDYELLLQCKQMQDRGFSRSEQAETMDASEAWISQSHSLLEGHNCVLRAMEKGQLTRTAALTFLNVPDDKVELVLGRAIDLTYQEAEIKEAQAQGELDRSLDELQLGENALRLSQFTGNHESARKARKQVARAGKNKVKAEKKLVAAKSKKKKKITVDVITKAAHEVDGAAENLNKPQSMKHARLIKSEIKEMLSLTEDDFILRPDTEIEYSRRDIDIVFNVVEWFLNQNHCKHPLDAILIADQSKN